MLSFDDMKNFYGNKTIGQIVKEESDFQMEETWDDNIASKTAYIYDFYHDDTPDLLYGMTHEHTTKTKIDIKLYVTEKGSIAKDDPTAKILFKPTRTLFNFDESDELSYLNERVKHYGMDNALTGLYIDIPDQTGLYRRWMILLRDIQGNQFQKWFVNPCTYNMEWIRRDGNKRIKQRMWCVLRSQSSYNSGLWTSKGTGMTTRENQEIVFIPTNAISESIWYHSEDSTNNQRLIVDVPCERPNVWQVSKVEKVNVRGRTKLTLYQQEFNQHKDYIEKDKDGNIIGMWADYAMGENIVDTSLPLPEIPDDRKRYKFSLSASDNLLKIGGSYKTISLSVKDMYDEDVLNAFENAELSWSFWIDDVDVTESNLIKFVETSSFNKIKIKFAKDKVYLSKILTIRVTDGNAIGELQLQLVSL